MATKPALRDYQRESLMSMRRFYRNGGRRGLVALPTGTGKTVVFSHVPAMMDQDRPGKTLVLAHREELLDQAAATIKRVNPDLRVEVDQAERLASRRSDVVVASIQTFAVSEGRMRRWKPNAFSTIIVDEAHHATANSYMKVLSYFGLAPTDKHIADMDLENVEGKSQKAAAIRKLFTEFTPSPDAPLLLGFTATPGRTDKRGLEWIFDDVVYSKTILEMMEAGWLCKIRSIQVKSEVSLDKVKLRAGDFALNELAETVNVDPRNALVISSYKKYAAPEKRQTLVFAVDVAHAETLHQMFVKAKVKAGIVTGTTKDRSGIIEDYRSGKINVLVNCMVLTEGFDAPETSCLIMARPTQSQLLYTQMLGRGTRLADGKEDLLVIDLVDAGKHGVPTVNTIFGLPPKLSLKDHDVLSMRKAMDELEDKVPMSALNNVTDIDDVWTMAEEYDPLKMIEPESWLKRSMAWFKTSYGYALSVGNEGQMGIVMGHLERAELRWKPKGTRPSSLGWYRDAQQAVYAAEDWIKRNTDVHPALVDKDAKWRRDPATEGQRNMAKRLGIKLPETATKGDASRLIDEAMSSGKKPDGGIVIRAGLEPTPNQLAWLLAHGVALPDGADRARVSMIIEETMAAERGRSPNRQNSERSASTGKKVWVEDHDPDHRQLSLGIGELEVSEVKKMLIELYRRQEADEQQSGITRYRNGAGFSGADAQFGSDLAKRIMDGYELSAKQLAAARKMLPKYRKQLGMS